MKRLGWLLLIGWATSAHSQLSLVGEGTARWSFFKLYDAKLYAPAGMNMDALLSDHTPLRLELCYHRELSPQNFIDGANHALPDSLSHELQQAVKQLHTAYQPVKAGDCYQLDYQPDSGTRLLLNNQPLVQIRTAEFKAVYFGIWLGNQPLSERLKTQLVTGL